MSSKVDRDMPDESAEEVEITPKRLDELIRWHGTDESVLPPAHTLQHLSRDTVAALRELAQARETIERLRGAIARAFWTADRRDLNAILLAALGPPPEKPRTVAPGGEREAAPDAAKPSSARRNSRPPKLESSQPQLESRRSQLESSPPQSDSSPPPDPSAAPTRLDVRVGRGLHHPGAARSLGPRVS